MEKANNKKYILIFSLILILSLAFMYVIINNKLKRYYTSFEDVEAYISGNEELQTILKGKDGKDGVNGTDGLNGLAGTNGVDGQDGTNGLAGANGTNGLNGQDGEDGAQGPAGTNGINGLNGQDGEDGATGTVSTATLTNITGIIKGTGTNINAAVVDVDYLTPGTVASSYLKLDASNGPITGDLSVQSEENSVNAFTVKDSSGNVVFSVDTVNKRLGIGTDSPASSFDLLGTARFGGAADYSEFESDGTLKMNGNATTWDDLRVIILTRTSSRVSPTFYAGLGGNSEIYSYRFDPATDNNVYFEVQMPHSWAGTKVYPHVHWTPATTGTGTVRWKLECTWSDFSSTFSTSFVYTMDSTIATASQWKHIIADPETGLTPTTSQNDISTMMICRLYRDGAADEDDYTGYAHLLAFDLHYEINTLGSRQMYSK